MADQLAARRQVAQVRLLQKLAAEGAVQRAAADHVRYGAIADARRGELEAHEVEWARQQAAPRLDPDLSRLAAGAIWRAQTSVDLAEGDRAWAARRETEAREAWRGASLRSETADERGSAAARVVRRRREEALLAEVADRRAKPRGGHED